MAWGYGERKKSMDVPAEWRFWEEEQEEHGYTQEASVMACGRGCEEHRKKTDTLAGCARRARLQETQDTLEHQGSIRTLGLPRNYLRRRRYEYPHGKKANDRLIPSRPPRNQPRIILRPCRPQKDVPPVQQTREPKLNYTLWSNRIFRNGSRSERQSGWRSHSKRARVILRGRGIGVSSETSMAIEQIYMHNL